MGHQYGGRGGITVGYEQDHKITQLTSMYFTQIRCDSYQESPPNEFSTETQR